MNRIFLLLGTNLGQKSQNLFAAQNMIEERIGVIRDTSSVYETAPWGKQDQPVFYNQVLTLDTSLGPQETLKSLQEIELTLGRVRKERWGERLIDIDILYFNHDVIKEPSLRVPHPGIPNRRFTLVPLVEIAPDHIHPQLGKTQKELLLECPDNLEVQPL